MRAGPAPAWLGRHVVPTRRPDPGTLLVPMLVLVATLASPLLVPVPAALLLATLALAWVVRRARAGGTATAGTTPDGEPPFAPL
ncbi:hypothetical protein [Rhodococcus triatomae]